MPVGDPNAYLDQDDVAGGLVSPCNIPSNNPGACDLRRCTPAPPTAEQFTAWAEDEVLQTEIAGWGSGLQEEDGLSLTDAQAQHDATFEYDAAMGGVDEGVGYLTGIHAAMADIPEAPRPRGGRPPGGVARRPARLRR